MVSITLAVAIDLGQGEIVRVERIQVNPAVGVSKKFEQPVRIVVRKICDGYVFHVHAVLSMQLRTRAGKLQQNVLVFRNYLCDVDIGRGPIQPIADAYHESTQAVQRDLFGQGRVQLGEERTPGTRAPRQAWACLTLRSVKRFHWRASSGRSCRSHTLSALDNDSWQSVSSLASRDCFSSFSYRFSN